MARIITKEHAEKLVDKLGATPSASQRRGSPHDLYDVILEDVFIGHISVRRGSERDSGHNHIVEELHLGPSKTKKLAQCSISVKQYIALLKEDGILQKDAEQPPPPEQQQDTPQQATPEATPPPDSSPPEEAPQDQP